MQARASFDGSLVLWQTLISHPSSGAYSYAICAESLSVPTTDLSGSSAPAVFGGPHGAAASADSRKGGFHQGLVLEIVWRARALPSASQELGEAQNAAMARADAAADSKQEAEAPEVSMQPFSDPHSHLCGGASDLPAVSARARSADSKLVIQVINQSFPPNS